MNEDQGSVNCSRYSVDELARFLAGALSPGRQKHLQLHLESCLQCRQKLHELTTVQAVLQRAPQLSLPRDFTLSAQDVRRGRRRLWYPVLRTATTAVATLVLLVFLGGLLQPGLLGSVGPYTAENDPTPRPVAVAPANTWRARPTAVAAGASTAIAPTAKSPEIAPSSAYPSPAESGPRIEATASSPHATTEHQPTSPPTGTLWSVLHLSGLTALGVLAGLTWLAYRRERAFFG